MKRFYPHFLNSMNWVLAGLLTLLGFSCSDSDDDGGGQVEEYGCPHANYEIKGKVVNRQNNPIPNIQIAIKQVVFDRGGYIYTGRVEALATGAREAGLEF